VVKEGYHLCGFIENNCEEIKLEWKEASINYE
jgi:hypothetical protein